MVLKHLCREGQASREAILRLCCSRCRAAFRECCSSADSKCVCREIGHRAWRRAIMGSIMGHPSSYDPDIASEICTLISTTTQSLAAICASSKRYPTDRTYYRWLLAHDDLRQLYARARESQMELMAAQILEIADDSSQDTIETPKGARINREWVERTRLRVDTRKWLMSKLAPRKYGERITHAGDSDQPLEVVVRRIGPSE